MAVVSAVLKIVAFQWLHNQLLISLTGIVTKYHCHWYSQYLLTLWTQTFYLVFSQIVISGVKNFAFYWEIRQTENRTGVELLEIYGLSKILNLKRQDRNKNGVLWSTETVRTRSLVSLHQLVVLSARLSAQHRRSVHSSSQSPHYHENICQLHSETLQQDMRFYRSLSSINRAKLSSLLSKIKEVKFNISYWVI